MSRASALSSAALIAGILVACGPTASVSISGPNGGGYYEGSTTTGTDGGIKGDGAASPIPMLAKIDPNASMMQTPGQGVGVFTQYTSATATDPGGHWYVWWTCDTNLSGQACPFEITISAAHGLITNATPQAFQANDQLETGDSVQGGQGIVADTNTTTVVQGVHFDTDPGEVITLSAALGGLYSGSFLFFVQDGAVDGNYKGLLTDPLELQPSSP
jgi:hypothetical protein